MKSFATIAITAATSIFFMQTCPAPFLPLVADLAATVAGNAVGEIEKRDLFSDMPEVAQEMENLYKRQNDIPQPALNQCRNQLRTANIRISQPGGNQNIRFDGVPPACMTLANVVIPGNGANRARPIPMGSAALQYNGVTQQERQALRRALGN